MTSTALEKMRTEFVGKTVFMNHRTMVPDDVFGAIGRECVVRRIEVPGGRAGGANAAMQRLRVKKTRVRFAQQFLLPLRGP